MEPLTRVKRAARRRASAVDDFNAAVREAVREGESLRAVAAAAGVSHVRVLQITRQDDPPA